MKSVSGMMGSSRGYTLANTCIALPLSLKNPLYIFKKQSQGSKIDWMQNLASGDIFDNIGEEAACMSILRGCKLDTMVEFMDSYRIPHRHNTLFRTNEGFKKTDTFPRIFDDHNSEEIDVFARLSLRRSTSEIVGKMVKCVEDKRKWDKNMIEIDLVECGENLQSMKYLYEEL